MNRRRFLSSSMAGLTGLVGVAGIAELATWRRTGRHLGVGVHTVTPDVVKILQSLHVTQVRMTLDWQAWVEARDLNHDGVPDNVAYQRNLASALGQLDGAGIESLIVVHTPPAGADYSMTQGRAALATLLGQLVRTAPYRKRVWQIMNEMDGDAGFNGGRHDWFGASDKSLSQRDRGDLYGQFLPPVYDAIKSADPSAIVVTGGIALEPTGFYKGLAQRTTKFDAVAVHCYGRPVAPVFRSKSIAMRGVVGSTPLWCTEFGNNSTDDAAQANDIRDVVADFVQNNRYDRAYLYNLITDVAKGDTYGIVRPDLVRRPAARLLLDSLP